jgi:hypothetical protein
MHLSMVTWLALALVAPMVACSSGKAVPAQDKGEQLHFGQGGGFTGAVTYYILLDDGRMFSRTADSTDIYLTTLAKPLTRQLFSHYRLVGLDKQSFNEPGNLYRFLELHAGGALVNRMTWGAEGFTPPSGLAEYHLLLMKSTKPKS